MHPPSAPGEGGCTGEPTNARELTSPPSPLSQAARKKRRAAKKAMSIDGEGFSIGSDTDSFSTSDFTTTEMTEDSP